MLLRIEVGVSAYIEYTLKLRALYLVQDPGLYRRLLNHVRFHPFSFFKTMGHHSRAKGRNRTTHSISLGEDVVTVYFQSSFEGML